MRRFGAFFLLLVFSGIPAFGYRISTWIPTWDPAALQSMQMNAGALDESNPSWYTINPDGSISKNWNSEDPALRAALTGTRLVPTIKNYINGRFDSAAMAQMLLSAESRENHADRVLQLVLNQAFDGIDIDYEAMDPANREQFSLFVELLASKLHASGKYLSVTVHAKTSDSANWNGPGAQDWPRIGAAADSIKIMAYDKHWSGSAPGPIAPLDWIENVTRYAVSAMPAEKVMIALPWYGYDWGTAGGTGITWSEATALANSTGSVIGRDANGEATFRYGSNTVFFQDGESYRRKVEHLSTRFPSLGGFAHWRAGSEDPATWNVIRDLRATGGAGASQPKGSFTITGGNRIQTTSGQPASETFSIVAIDGFASAVQARMEMIDKLPASVLFPAGTLRAGESATLTVTPAADAPAGTYRVKIIFEAETNRIEHLVSIEVAKKAAVGSFEVSGPSTVSVRAGKQTEVTFGVFGRDGFTSTVSARMEQIDAIGGTVTFATTALLAGGSATATIAPAGSLEPGTYQVRFIFEAETNRVEKVLQIEVTAASRGRAVRR